MPCEPPAKPALLGKEDAQRLQSLFKILANDTRLRMLQALRQRQQLCVSDLAEIVEMKPQAVSNQLQKLASNGIVDCCRTGNNIHYRICNPCVEPLLDLAVCLSQPGCTTARIPEPLRSYASLLAATSRQVELEQSAVRRAAMDNVAQWLGAAPATKPLVPVIVVCTGNSRRSMLGAALGNLAAAHYGLTHVRCFSGGTAPTAFNHRTLRTLQEVGFMITATGDEAARGEPQTPNPRYEVRWGENLQMVEYSKHFADPSNPQSDFAAVMVCSEADQQCPAVRGAAIRVPLPFNDPKEYDDQPQEAAEYARRRDEIGRVMFAIMAQAAAIREEQCGLG